MKNAIYVMKDFGVMSREKFELNSLTLSLFYFLANLINGKTRIIKPQ